MANEHALAAWRKTKNLSQEELGVKLDISRWMVNSIETGRRQPSWSLMNRIGALTSGAVTPNDFSVQPENAS
ncbi:helix-turn-helix transcriptional regulator [Rhizobium lentis]|uniref:helix-turn-helix transcriptional regulator n=1 Tax=Rhizobium lentis TaxID=1138194 RepID=UPI001C8346F9|nr:helix-turn-helix transcriptional regulator [Rhizobium lentis]MBX5131638.1 helix-turn-helix transcriptional regulator [Rhizobium lentis]